MQSVLNNRYLRNKNTITETDQKVLHTKKVLIIGLGALGGFLFEQLTRIGVGHILGYDYDLVSSLYHSNDVGIESIVGNPIYTATIIASLMSKLSIDVLLAKNTSNDLHYVVNLDELEIIEIIKPQNKL